MTSPAQRQELALAVAAAVLLVAVRSFVPLAYEQVYFDSDQAIVGLMAKHLSELRAFPLFFYGQNYMLGVQAWIAAPFVWLGGPTVTMIRLPLLIVNATVPSLLILMMSRLGVRPALAFVAALPLIVTTPVMSMALYATLGASVEPFLYVLGLWWLRRRPLAFGALLCLGTLHREFTILTLPALAFVHLIERRPVRWPAVARGAAGFAATWLAIDVLKLGLHAGSLTQEAQTIGGWLSSDVSGYLARFRSLVTAGVPVLFGGRAMSLDHYGINSTIGAGSSVAGVALAAATGLSLVRLVRLTRDAGGRERLSRGSFFLYLGAVALATIAVYGLNGRIDPIRIPLVRYVLFGLLLPVAIFGAWSLAESSRAWLIGVTALIALWAAFTLRDNVLLIREYGSRPPANEFRMLADYLVAHRIQYGYATYWDAYIVDFLSGEQVILTTNDVIRVVEYDTRVRAHDQEAVTIEREPCTVGTRLAAWCIDDPLKR
ncbi:MAG TPA: hypothetical protein VJN96_03545 [Vicinamibacterales bacterium]|nr:hypothetical protein [Vicinamibacterales bacterium]